MKTIKTILLMLIAAKLVAQPVKPIQVEYNGKLYWKYESVDTNNNTPFKFYYQYDSTGKYLGWVYEFPENGDWINFYKEDSTKVASIFYIKNNLLNGISTQYYLSGRKKSELEFYNNEENGYVKCWNEKGILTQEHKYAYKDYEHFQSSVRVGEWKNWDDNGNLTRVNNFIENEPHGSQLEFYENGQIQKEEFYVNGERDSTQTIFHPNGQITKQVKYKNGQFIEENPNIEYHPNGKISGIGNLENGRKIEKWTYYYENEVKESEGDYGTYIYKHEHGDFYFYLKKGFWSYWYSNGNKKAEGTYGNEIIDSSCFSDDLQVPIATRKNDWKYFDENGKEISQSKFEEMKIKINDY